MDPKAQYIFDALSDAEVSITDMSRLTSISRVSLHKWFNGSVISDQLRLNLAYTTAQRMRKAFDKDRLPLPNKLKPKERLAALRSIIAEMAQA